jgi:hypothetical protein
LKTLNSITHEAGMDLSVNESESKGLQTSLSGLSGGPQSASQAPPPSEASAQRSILALQSLVWQLQDQVSAVRKELMTAQQQLREVHLQCGDKDRSRDMTVARAEAEAKQADQNYHEVKYVVTTLR